MGKLKVHLTPKSSREEVIASDGVVKAWVRAAPTDGQANEALCKLLADRLHVSKTSVTVVRGHTSREKTVEVDNVSEQEIMMRLRYP